MTQKEAVIKYMEDFGSISSMEAFKDLGVTRLSGIIYVLRRKEGYDIESEDETIKNRYGKNVTFSRYKFKSKA